MALITFGSDAKSSFTFADRNYHNADTIKAKAEEAISYVPKHDGTRTDLAEDLAVKDVFTSRGGDRPSFGNVMIILTDGKFWINETWDKRAEVDFNVTTRNLKVIKCNIEFSIVRGFVSANVRDVNISAILTHSSCMDNDVLRKKIRPTLTLSTLLRSRSSFSISFLNNLPF